MTWQEKRAHIVAFHEQHRGCGGSAQWQAVEGGRVTVGCDTCKTSIRRDFDVGESPIWKIPDAESGYYLMIGDQTEASARMRAAEIASAQGRSL